MKPATPNPAASNATAAADGATPGSSASTKLPPGLENLDISGDFAKELADGMAALMREIAAEAGEKPEENLTGTDAPPTQEQLEKEAAFRKVWEEMLVEGMNGALDTNDFGVNKKGKAAAKPGELDGPKVEVNDDSFQASIRKAMDKLKESDTALHVCCLARICVCANKEFEQADSASGEDPFEALLSQLGGGGGESEEELHGILETMMAQLMSKDVLYEPLKELNDKVLSCFPWQVSILFSHAFSSSPTIWPPTILL